MLDPHNKIIERFRYDPSVIVGRRGSGKTSFLYGASNYDVTESISTAKTFSEIVLSINSKTDAFIFPENVAELWENLFTLSIFRATALKYKEPANDAAILRDYCAKQGLSPDDSVEDWLWKLVRIARDKVKNEAVSSVAAVVSALAGEDYDKAREALFRMLRTNKARAVLLIDSLEQYPVRMSTVAHAMAGLLMCVGEFNERHDCLHVRICLPAEMYHEFMELAPNPVKNFSHGITLHWHASELLNIAANRLKIYLAIHYPQYIGNELEPVGKDKANDFLQRFLPKQVTNGYGGPEPAIAYILRHTQLMPRHLLRILNTIFREAHSGGLESYPKVDARNVVRGIKLAEVNLADEVCSAFKIRYPTLRSTCEKSIPHLPYKFSEGMLQQVFNRHGKKASGFDDFEDYKRMLIETAAIGRVTDTEDPKYVNGQFEYTAAHKLITSTHDELCLHPIFSEVFQFDRSQNPIPVYPFGTDPDSADYRDCA